MKFLLLTLIPTAIFLSFVLTVYEPLYSSYTSLIAKKHADEQKIDTLEKAKVEQFYRGVYEVCMVLKENSSQCLTLVKQGAEEHFYNDSAGGWKWPLTNTD